jgi:phytoene dehydrogenase-like protein
MIAYVESRFTGFEALIDFYELGTPLTVEHYTAHPAGIIYGIPATPARFHSKSIGFRTPLKNLYLTGSDTSGHGITGAMMSGVLTTAMINGLPGQLIKIFSRAQKFHARLKEKHADH